MEAQPSRLAQAGSWYLQQVDALSTSGWTKPTLCEGWTAANVVAHVVTGDQLIRGLVWDATGKGRDGQDLPVDFADRHKRFEVASTWEPAKLKVMAHKESEQTVAAVAEAVQTAPEAIVTMPIGRVPMTVLRGMRLNEYIIHGHDLMPAIGRSIPIPDWFSERALSDAVTRMVRLHPRSPHKGKSASFHLHRTDGEGEWILRAVGGEAMVVPGHAKADVAMRGTAEGLYWVLMGRGKPEEHGVEVHGDQALAAAFKEWFPGP
ncbi:MAG TPA: maleylpyruvate isomerase family mycothiol-dependent enzyme [Candidatus Dormibacteraeota bacterium]|nr:maleylpyruvate isomerase family mycothiol-dependent enzyme [Candidatus Dormibacteraeota bacterium]